MAGVASRGLARHGAVRCGLAWLVCCGAARLGPFWRGELRHGRAGLGVAGMVRRASARHGAVRLGGAWCGRLGLAG